MAEENEPGEAGAQATAGGSAIPAALAVGLGGATSTEADAFLRDQRILAADQRRMLHLQMEEMQAEEPYKLSHFRLRRFSGWAKAVFEFSAGLLGLSVVVSLSVMVWSAAHSDGLVIESFTVPPDLAEKGLTGQAVSNLLLDKLAAMQRATGSARPNQGYSGGSSDEIKVEIPETGVSISELYRFLRRWLGHETHVTGEVYHAGDNLAISMRAGVSDAATARGAEGDLETMLQKTAGSIYRATQPFLYVRYILPVANPAAWPPHLAEGREILARLTTDPSKTEQAFAWNQLGLMASTQGDFRQAEALFYKATSLDPSVSIIQSNLGSQETQMGHAEQSLAAYRAYQNLVPHDANAIDSKARGLMSAALVAIRLGNYAGAREALNRAREDFPSAQQIITTARLEAMSIAGQHDDVAASYQEVPSPARGPYNTFDRLALEASLQDWPAVVANAGAAEMSVANTAYQNDRTYTRFVSLNPPVALARAHLGDFAAAEELIAPTSGDCYPCLMVRAQIASLQGQQARADWWFARATAIGPSLPFAEAEWGKTLLARGKQDDAIAKFKLANKKSPHFADALEGWGEALMAKNRSDLAVAKFAEAEKYAPNWGRLHLKWGEALAYAGKKEEAAKHFARAAALDLTPSEKAELQKVPHG